MQKKKESFREVFKTAKYIGFKEIAELLYHKLFFTSYNIQNLINDFERLDPYLAKLDLAVIITEVPVLNILHVSSSITELLGSSKEYVLSRGAKFIFENACHLDKNTGVIFLKVMNSYEEKNAPELQKDRVFSSTFRLYHSQGYFKAVASHLKFFSDPVTSKPLYSISILQDIDSFRNDDSMVYALRELNVNNSEFLVKSDRVKINGQEFFSNRDKMILQLLSTGNTNEEISVKLNLSESTIQDYRKKMLKKTWCSNTAELVYFALRNGLIE